MQIESNTATATTSPRAKQTAASTTIDKSKDKEIEVPELTMVDASEEFSSSHPEGGGSSSSSSSESENKQQQDKLEAERRQRRLDELEAAAVDQAKAAADAAFSPSPSILNAPTAAVLLRQVDGPSLQDVETRESVYVGRSIPVVAGGKLEVPISVTTPGSVVEYAVELQAADISFGITAEREEEGVTVVKEPARMDAVAESPLTQKFLVGTVPCMLQFRWDNGYSWLREKVVSYKITVTPPSTESLQAGRRRRASACLKAVQDDLQAAQTRLTAATTSKQSLHERVASLMKLLHETKQSLQVAEKEEAWLLERCALRVEQEKLLLERLQHGWADDDNAGATSNGN